MVAQNMLGTCGPNHQYKYHVSAIAMRVFYALNSFRDAKINEASQVEVPAVSILCMVHLLGENQGSFIIW